VLSVDVDVDVDVDVGEWFERSLLHCMCVMGGRSRLSLWTYPCESIRTIEKMKTKIKMI